MSPSSAVDLPQLCHQAPTSVNEELVLATLHSSQERMAFSEWPTRAICEHLCLMRRPSDCDRGSAPAPLARTTPPKCRLARGRRRARSIDRVPALDCPVAATATGRCQTAG